MEMKTLHYEMSELVHGGVQQINRTRMIERKTWTVPIGSWDVAVMRGKVLEKTTTTRIILATKHPETGEDTRFYAAAGSDHEPGARALWNFTFSRIFHSRWPCNWACRLMRSPGEILPLAHTIKFQMDPAYPFTGGQNNSMSRDGHEERKISCYMLKPQPSGDIRDWFAVAFE